MLTAKDVSLVAMLPGRPQFRFISTVFNSMINFGKFVLQRIYFVGSVLFAVLSPSPIGRGGCLHIKINHRCYNKLHKRWNQMYLESPTITLSPFHTKCRLSHF